MARTTTRLIATDCLTWLEEYRKNDFDLVVTSPPYNVDLGNNKFNRRPYDVYRDNKDHSIYLEWLGEILVELNRVVKPGGRLALVLGDGKNGKVPTCADVVHLAVKAGWLPMANIAWLKNHRSNGCAWGSWKSPSCPSFPMNRETILVFANGSFKLKEKGETDLTREEFLEYAKGEWTIAPERRAKDLGHPAPFPEEIPHRLIKMLSWVGAKVLDPFVGSGTTAVVAKLLGRSCVGLDVSEEYVRLSEERIRNA